MPTYKYTAYNKNGKKVKQTIEATSIDVARSNLRSIGYTILEIAEPNAFNRDLDIPFLGNPKAKDLAIFCRQFVSIIRAGVPIADILSMLGQQTSNKKLSSAIRSMQTDIEKGETLANAMRKHRHVFPDMLANMVSAGEQSGNLEASFSQMEVYFEKVKRTTNAVKRAMIYPIVLVVVMIIVLIIMMTKILPKFLAAFDEMGAELPGVTKAVMAVSNWFVEWWWLVLAVLVVLVIGCVLFNMTDKGRHFFGLIARKFPIVSKVTERSASATFCRTLSMLLASGVSLIESLELASSNMKNVYFKEAVKMARLFVSRGWPLHSSIADSRLFPPMVSNMIAIGEDTGDLENMLSKTADYYDEELNQATAQLLGLLEPAMIIFMAFFVVIIVLSIFLPMLNMTKMYDQYLQ